MTEAQLKAKVRERDGMICTKCGLSQKEHRARHGRGLEVHRRNPGSPYTVEGCVTLCKGCHGKEPGPVDKKSRNRDNVPGLSEALRIARTTAGLSQIEAGQRSGVHHVSIAKFETDKSTPTLRVLIKLADTYGVTVVDLLPESLTKKSPAKTRTRTPRK